MRSTLTPSVELEGLPPIHKRSEALRICLLVIQVII